MKKYLFLGGLAYLGYQAFQFGNNKVSQVKNVVERLKVRVTSINNVKIVDGGVTFYTNLEVINTTAQGLDVQSNQIVSIRRINFFTEGGQFLGVATPNITGINLPPNQSVNLKSIPTFVEIKNFGVVLDNAIGLFLDPNRLRITTEITALGKTFTV